MIVLIIIVFILNNIILLLNFKKHYLVINYSLVHIFTRSFADLLRKAFKTLKNKKAVKGIRD